MGKKIQAFGEKKKEQKTTASVLLYYTVTIEVLVLGSQLGTFHQRVEVHSAETSAFQASAHSGYKRKLISRDQYKT